MTWLFLLLLSALFSAACRDVSSSASPTPFSTATLGPTASHTPAATTTPTATATPAGTVRHEFDAGGFSLLLPGDWIVNAQGETPLGFHYLLGPEPIGPGPASSAIFVADTRELSPVSVAEALFCAGDCAEDIKLEETEIAGRPVQFVLLEYDGEITLTWYFLENDDSLIVLSLHDPVTLADRADLLEFISFDAVTESDGIETAELTPTPLPESALEPVRSWRRFTPDTIALSFETPAGWAMEEDALIWRPDSDSPFGLSFHHERVVDSPFVPENWLPSEATVVISDTPELAWTSEATSYTVELENGPASLVVIPVGDQGAIVFRAEAQDHREMALLEPILNHVVDSVRLNFIIERFIAEPNEAPIGFFQALIDNPDADSGLQFLSPALREEVPAGAPPADLLQLDQRFIEYNLDWEYISDNSVLATVDLLLADGSEVTRELLLIRIDELGWRIEAITTPADSS